MKSLLTIGLLAAAVSSTAASAGSICLERLATDPGRAVRYTYDASRSWFSTNSSAGAYGLAGVNLFRVAGDYDSRVKAFCVEINEGFVDDPICYEYTQVENVPEHTPPGPMSSAKVTLMNDLYSRHYYSVVNQGAQSDEAYNNRAAAFQLVVWEISHENFSTDTNAVTANQEMSMILGAMAFVDFYDASVLLMANEMIASLGGPNGDNFMTMSGLFGLTNENNQDLLIVVPTPAIAGLAGLGLVGMRRRRR